MQILHQPEDIISQHYRIVTKLGQGGFGTTYEAEDLTNYQRVAIKVVSLRQISDWKVLERFEREAQVLANLNHQHIPKYIDYFHLNTPNDRRFYLVQELIAGFSLAELVQNGWHADETEVKRIALQILDILNYLHQLTPPVIHRDIKPQNIIRCSDGTVFLVDFGAVQDIYWNTLSQGSTFVGTLGYMPLEQMQGQVSFASDFYALGATLLFLLTHRAPSELPESRLKIDFRSRVQICEPFANWLEKMLEPVVEDRFKSAQEAIAALNSKSITKVSTHYLAPKHRQPTNSRIIFKKTCDRLLIDIPPHCEGAQNLVLSFYLAVFLLLSFHIILTIISDGLNAVFVFLYLGLFTSPLWLFISYLIAWAVTGRERLEIDREHFKIQTQFRNSNRQSEGQTASMDVGFEVRRKPKGGTTTHLVIWNEENKYDFGWMISPQEKEWLEREIKDFLNQLGS